MKKLNQEWMGNSNKAIAIVRVSSHRQKDNSPEVQKAEIKEYCRNVGLELPSESIISIVESAKDHEERAQYRGAIDYAVKHKIRHIIFYMTDREGRNHTDIETNKKLIKKDLIVCHYARDRRCLWKGSSQGEFMMRQVQAMQDTNVSDSISIKVNDSQIHKSESGWYPGNHAPLGYVHHFPPDENGRPRKRGSVIIMNPNQKVVSQVLREFQLCAQGFSVAEVRRIVIEEGFILPSKIKSYSKNGIDGRLKNPFYSGSFIWKNIEYKGKHEVFIPKPILDAVKARFGHKKVRRRASEEKGIFSGGWLRCGHPECGLQIVCEHTKKPIKETGERKEFKYYRCSNSRGIHKSLKGMYQTEDELMAQFEPALDKISITQQRAQEIAEALSEADRLAKEAIHKEVQEYERALKALQDRRSKLVDLKIDGQIGLEDYNFKMAEIEKDMKHYMRLQEDAQYKISDAWKLTAETVLELAKEAKELWKKGSMTERLEILKRVCWNPILDGVNLRYGLRKPFATLAEMSGNQNWRSQGDLNPCILREREVS